ncbi:MAG: hypothetical protein J6T16_05625, partial [Opitutales bacterium]|nr:hypothetical protein [Opitutales bacterium]
MRISTEDGRSEAELEGLNAKFRDLYERYKGGDQTAYEEAAKLVAEEGRRKGYEVRVYHGTGADGYNVAKADSSEAQNGEGAQAHGKGLYLAVSRDVANRYRRTATKKVSLVYNGKQISKNDLTQNGSKVLEKVLSIADKVIKGNFAEIIADLEGELQENETEVSVSELMLKSKDLTAHRRLVLESTMDFRKKRIKELRTFVNNFKELAKELGAESNLKDITLDFGKGTIFDWFHNMKFGEVINQDEGLNEQPEIVEKLKKAYKEDFLPFIEKEYADEKNRAFYRELFDPTKETSYASDYFDFLERKLGAKKTVEILLKHGIRGTKYVGGLDEEVYTSFEGGATVKLQDPFTFDDDGNLIPLTERFDSTNPDMRFKFVQKWARQATADDIFGPVDPRGEDEYKRYKSKIGKPYEKLKIKPVLHPNLQLPRSFRDKKIGIAGPAGIRRWVLAALDIPFTGEVSPASKRAGMAGAYYFKRDTLHLRDDQLAELNTLFHEIGHAVDRRVFNGRAADVPLKIREELVRWIVENGKKRGLAIWSYPKEEVPGEGWAEFMADFMLDPAAAKKNLPLTFAFFSAALNDNKDLKKIMMSARKMIVDYVSAPEAKRAQVHVVSDSELNSFKEPLLTRIYRSYEKIGRSFADLFGSLTDLQDYINAVAGEGAATFDTRRKNYMGGALGQSELSLKYKQVDLNGKFVGDSLADILKPVWDNAQDFRTFIIARRAMNIIKNDKTLPRNPPRQALDDYCFENFGLSYFVLKNAYDSASFTFKAASAKLDAFNKNNLRLLVDGGIISKSFAAKMEKTLGYVPLRRLLELEGDTSVSQSSSSNASPIYARHGSAREIVDPLQIIMENAVIFRNIAQKNLIKREVVDSVSKLSGYGKILEQDIERLKATAVDRASVARAIVEANLASEVLGMDIEGIRK